MKKHTWRDKSKNQANHSDFNKVATFDETSEDLFSLQIPQYFKKNIDFNNPKDPLLLQVLPSKHEHISDEAFINDPVGDLDSRKGKGVIHKYQGRVLLIATGTCAINCRYCFRRSFPYTQNNASAKNWQEAIRYIQDNKDLHEVILSGGDPLMLSTKVLTSFSNQLVKIKHIKTLRIHTRIPIVTPSRINKAFINWLNNIPLKKVMVVHCNHPQELQNKIKKAILRIKKTDTLLLNQSVLLNNINDNYQILLELSHKLFDFGILPYYLNQLDKITGTSHFLVSRDEAKAIHKKLLQNLPGYLVPKLVEEISGKKNKSPIF